MRSAAEQMNDIIISETKAYGGTGLIEAAEKAAKRIMLTVWMGPFPQGEPWFGVDLDGTLAHYEGWQGADHIGEPIPAMMDRVRKWMCDGHNVAIVTARMSVPEQREQVREVLEAWMVEHIGMVIPVTHQKDFGMVELWDDRAVQVLPNTGVPISEERHTCPECETMFYTADE